VSGSRRQWSGEPLAVTALVAAEPLARLVSLPGPRSIGAAEPAQRAERWSWLDWAADRRADRDRLQVLHLVDELVAVTHPVGRLRRLLELVAELLQAEVCCFSQYDLPAGRRMTLRWPDGTALATAEPANPAGAVPRQLSPAQYRTLFAPLPTPYQLAIPLRLDTGIAIGCTAGRRARAFTDEQGLATALQLALAPLRLSLLPGPDGPLAAPARSLLTAREQEILTQLATGMTARAIGRALGVSPRTVYKHLEHLYAKLGVNDRLSAVTQAQALGLLPLPIRQMSPDPAPAGPVPTTVHRTEPAVRPAVERAARTAIEAEAEPAVRPALQPALQAAGVRRGPPPPVQVVPAAATG
jgi:DNA-binding CsgD family transcriptional regulator